MTDILASIRRDEFTEFVRLFRPEEGRMGVAVTFIAILELVREGLIEIVQNEPYAPIHVRAGKPDAPPPPLTEDAFEPMPDLAPLPGDDESVDEDEELERPQ
jgi:segregation and condensation protein A